MAHRDRSQGFGFVYLDVDSLLKQDGETYPLKMNGGQIVNFNKDPHKKNNPAVSSSDQPKSITEIRENLDRLQSLHHKLHVMLEEINQLGEREKKNKK